MSLRAAAATRASVIPSFATPLRAALFGDSHLGQSIAGPSVNSFVVNAQGIATVTAASNHAINPGNFAQIYNLGDPTYAASANGAYVQALTVPSNTVFTFDTHINGKVMPAGDYSAQNWLVHCAANGADYTWFNWWNWYNKNQFALVACYAQGTTLSGIWNPSGSQLPAKVLVGVPFDVFFLDTGTNNVNNNVNSQATAASVANTVIADITAFAQLMMSAGKIGFIATPCSFTGNASPFKAEAQSFIAQGILRLCAQYRGVLFAIDTFGDCINGTDANGNSVVAAPVLNDTGGGIHLSSAGCVRIAQFEPYPTAYLEVIDRGPRGIMEDALTLSQVATSPYLNLVQHGSCDTAGGGVAGGTLTMTGSTIMTGWSITGQSGTGTVLSSAAQARTAIANTNKANQGFALTLVCTAMSNGSSFQIASPFFQTQIQAALADPVTGKGRWWQCGFFCKVLGASSGFQGFNPIFQLGGQTYGGLSINSAANFSIGYPWAVGDTFEMATYPLYIPLTIDGTTPTAITAARFLMSCNFMAAAGALNVELTQFYCRPIENLNIPVAF